MKWILSLVLVLVCGGMVQAQQWVPIDRHAQQYQLYPPQQQWQPQWRTPSIPYQPQAQLYQPQAYYQPQNTQTPVSPGREPDFLHLHVIRHENVQTPQTYYYVPQQYYYPTYCY